MARDSDAHNTIRRSFATHRASSAPPIQGRDCYLFVEIVFDSGDDAHGFAEAGVGGAGADVEFAGFAGVAALIGSENGEDTLIGLTNTANFGAGIGGKAIGGGARVARGLGDHVGLDGVEAVELVNDAQALARVAAEHDALLHKLHGFLSGGSDLVHAGSADGDFQVDDIAVRSALPTAEFVGLSVHDADDALLDFGRLDALLGKELLDGVFVSFSFGVDGGEVVAGFLRADGPNSEIGFDLAFDEAFDGDVAVAKTRGLDFRAED